MAHKNQFLPLFPILFLSLFYSLFQFQFHSLEAAKTSPNNGTCIPRERGALLEFKKGLLDPSGWLSSWTSRDCCRWAGVTCNNLTGHVTKLDLRSPDDFCVDFFGDPDQDLYMPQCLSGELSQSLLQLKHLTYLDLSKNNFQGIRIPGFIGSMTSLRYLDLSLSSFGGMVPSSLGNLSNLLYLDLSVDYYSNMDLWVSDLDWLPGLSSLNYLKLLGVDLKNASHHWSEKVTVLSSLIELNLIGCQLSNISYSVPSVNFTSLSIIDISQNNFNSSLPQWLFNISTLVELRLGISEFRGPIPLIPEAALCNLQQLDLSFNNITGDIEGLVAGLSGCRNSSLEKLDLTQNLFSGSLPRSLGFLGYLKSLRLSQNSFSGPMPSSLGNLSLLEELQLGINKMNGTIPETIGQLKDLTKLDLSSNSWEGVVTEAHFNNLTKLVYLGLSSDVDDGLFKFSVKPAWIPPFDLKVVKMAKLQLGPAFPKWLKTQKNLSTIVLSTVAISDSIPDWLWEFPQQLDTLDLSGNRLTGKVPSPLAFQSMATVNLASNLLEGPFPLWSSVYRLSLRNNLLSGNIPSRIERYVPGLRYLDVANNSLAGSIPSSISRLKNLAYLDLSQNLLSGNVFSNWTTMPSLKILDLSRNNITGEIPSSMCSLLPSLEWLKLSTNRISGKLSSAALNCSRLYTIDLGENNLHGSIPKLTHQSLESLSELLLRANRFRGNIPEQFCSSPNLHILHLSDNDLSGPIPRCIGDMVGMKSYGTYYQLPVEFRSFYSGNIELDMKERRMGYSDLIPLVNLIDFSRNNISGEIPEGITDLSHLGTLNLSRNQLTGKIPESISLLRSLETLDLSLNHLSGQIPPSMTSMTFLSHFNVSYNNLSGQIPFLNQFQTFNGTSIYEGNPGLCGPPLLTSCSSTPQGQGDGDGKDDREDDKDDLEKLWLYVFTGAGFIVGFWSVCGSLAVKTSWRHAYFRFVDRMKDRIYVFVVVNILSRLRRKEERPGDRSVPDFILHPSLPSVRQ